jgi:hypothetical protein
MEILYETEIIGARSRELMHFLWICIDDELYELPRQLS